MKKWVLFLHEGLDGAPVVESGDVVGRYREWLAGIGKNGMLVGGEKLTPGPGTLLATYDGAIRVGWAETQAPGVRLIGFFVIAAATVEEAVRVARDCPHLASGGRIEVREVA